MNQLFKRRSADIVSPQSTSCFFLNSCIDVEKNMAPPTCVVMDVEPYKREQEQVTKMMIVTFLATF